MEKRGRGRPMSHEMKTALELVSAGGLSVEHAAAEVGLTPGAIYKAIRVKKPNYEWAGIVQGPDSGTRKLIVTASTAGGALAVLRKLTSYDIVGLQRKERITEAPRRSLSQSDTTPPTP